MVCKLCSYEGPVKDKSLILFITLQIFSIFFHDFLLLIQPDCKTCDIPSFIPYVVIHNDSYKLGSI